MTQHKHKPLIFIHIPKTAGTTLRHLLIKHIENNSYYDDSYCLDKNIQYVKNISKSMDMGINIYKRSGYFSLYGLAGWDTEATYPPTNDMFNFNYINISTVGLWNYWINNVKDKYNKIIELHLNINPLPTAMNSTYAYTYDYTESIANDLLTNELYYNFNWMTIIRNPIERVISEFYFINERFDNISLNEKIPMGFKLFGHLPTGINTDISKYSKLKETANTQVKWLLGKGYLNDYEITEDDYDKLINAMKKLNFKVGIQDKFGDSLDYFNKSFNFNIKESDIQSWKINHNKPIIGEEVKEIIRKNNKWDIKLYNYWTEYIKSAGYGDKK